MPASLVISLDFELYWGVFESKDIDRYGPNILGAHRALPAILDLLEGYEVKATVAIVGLLFHKNLTEARSAFPLNRPGYSDSRFSPYHLPNPDGPMFFAPEAVTDLLRRSDRHEVATHTFSHYFCCQPGQTVDQFRQDLLAALAAGQARGVNQTSIVFPRNQIDSRYLEVCSRLGLRAFRGNQTSWLYRTSNRSFWGRVLRLVDSYLNLSGANAHDPHLQAGLLNIPASAYLRPHFSRLPWLDCWQRTRIQKAMTTAARRDQCFHIWWHPHNFGTNLVENLRNLESVLGHFQFLRRRYGMTSKTMRDFCLDL